MPYTEAFALQESLRDELARGLRGETILLLEHPDVITYGRAAKAGQTRLSRAALHALGYEIQCVNRGGDVTWHGPGQLVGYPILDLRHHGADLHAYLRALEGVLIEALEDFGVAARRRAGFAGVWLDEVRKIASIGVGVRSWRTLHGFALNVCCDLARFDPIVPCGLADVRMVSLSSVLGRPVTLDEALPGIEARLRKVFG